MSEVKSVALVTNENNLANELITLLKSENLNVFIYQKLTDIDKTTINVIVLDCAGKSLQEIKDIYRQKNEVDNNIPMIFFKMLPIYREQFENNLDAMDEIEDYYQPVQNMLHKVLAVLKKLDIYSKFLTNVETVKHVSIKSSVLLVDDDAYILKLIEHNLTGAGYDCIVASKASEALELATKHKPDLILSDVLMPEIDGFEFRKMLLANNDLKDIPFVFLTSKTEEDDMLNAYNLDIEDYIVKTSGPKLVVAKVSAILKSLGKERQKVVQELNKALDNFQFKVVPESIPQIDKFCINHWHQPYQGIPGGDFIDYYQIDNHRLLLVLGDVMGKKWNAWYFAVAYAGYIRSSVRFAIQNSNECLPSDIINQVNRTVYNDAKIAEVFATLSVLLLDNEHMTVKYSGAGDLPINVITESGARQVQSDGLLLGFSEFSNYQDITIEVSPEDVIVLATDGISESRNDAGEAFGKERLDYVIKQTYSKDNPTEFIKYEFSEFVGSKFEDDISLITVKAR